MAYPERLNVMSPKDAASSAVSTRFEGKVALDASGEITTLRLGAEVFAPHAPSVTRPSVTGNEQVSSELPFTVLKIIPPEQRSFIGERVSVKKTLQDSADQTVLPEVFDNEKLVPDFSKKRGRARIAATTALAGVIAGLGLATPTAASAEVGANQTKISEDQIAFDATTSVRDTIEPAASNLPSIDISDAFYKAEDSISGVLDPKTLKRTERALDLSQAVVLYNLKNSANNKKLGASLDFYVEDSSVRKKMLQAQRNQNVAALSHEAQIGYENLRYHALFSSNRKPSIGYDTSKEGVKFALQHDKVAVSYGNNWIDLATYILENEFDKTNQPLREKVIYLAQGARSIGFSLDTHTVTGQKRADSLADNTPSPIREDTILAVDNVQGSEAIIADTPKYKDHEKAKGMLSRIRSRFGFLQSFRNDIDASMKDARAGRDVSSVIKTLRDKATRTRNSLSNQRDIAVGQL